MVPVPGFAGIDVFIKKIDGTVVEVLEQSRTNALADFRYGLFGDIREGKIWDIDA